MRAWLGALAFLSTTAHARVFNWKDATVAPYMRGTAQTMSLGQSAFEDSIPAGDTIDGSARFGYGGELGVLLGATPFVRVRLGAELMQAQSVGETTAAYRLDSSVSVFNPNVTFEYAGMPQGSYRYYGFASVGYAMATVENKFRDSSAGDYAEIAEGRSVSGAVGIGVEWLFTESATLALDLGYRYLRLSSLKYKASASGLSGDVTKGDVALDRAGQPRALDLGGVTVGIGFRFYLNFL